MIELDDLETRDKGRWVVYRDSAGKVERGRIKSWNHAWIFVVYKCADDWDRYWDYTAAATDPRDLEYLGGEQDG